MASDNPDEWWQHSPEEQQKDFPSGQWQQGHQSQGGQQAPGVQWGQTAGQVPQPGPPPGAWEVPPLGAGGYGSPPPKNNGPLIGVLIAVVVLVLVGMVGLVVLQSRGPEGETAHAADGTSSEVTDSGFPSASVSATSTTATTSALPSSGAPALREGLPPVAVLGPTWQAGEDTYTMAFQGWPFAFRAPGSWGCIKGSVDKIPDAQAWGCVDEGNSAGQRVNLILRKCSATCDAATQSQFNADWFDDSGKVTRFDDRTSYVRSASNDKGKFTVDLSRFFASQPGGEPVWQVGVFAEYTAGAKDVVLKTVNDIVTQTQ